MPVLCDTVCVWALYFRDSAYRSHVLELRGRHGLVVPDTCLLEAAYPIYKAKGVGELAKYSEFLRHLPLAPGIQVLETVYEDFMRALDLAGEHPDVFVDEAGNLCLFDAILASVWLRVRLPLATSNKRLISLAGRIPELGDRVVELEKRIP